MIPRILLFFPFSAICFGSLETSRETVDQGDVLVHTRNGSVISRTFLDSGGKATIQHLYFEGKEVFVIANDPAVNNVYHKSIGHDGLEIMEYEVDSKRKLTIGNPAKGRIEVFDFQNSGFVEPISDEELAPYGYIPLNGECFVLPNQK